MQFNVKKIHSHKYKKNANYNCLISFAISCKFFNDLLLCYIYV